MSGTYQGVPLFWGDTPLRPGSSSKSRFDTGASRGVQGRPGTNRLEWLENEFAALFVGGGENFEKIFLIDININQKIAGFDCTFYNYLDGFEQVCSYISPVI